MRRFAPAAAFVILALAVVGAFARAGHNDAVKLRNLLVEGCHRSNRLRAESNRRIASHVADRDVLLAFIAAARRAREAAYRRGHAPEDLAAAHRYGELEQRLQRVTFRRTPLIDCARAYPPV